MIKNILRILKSLLFERTYSLFFLLVIIACEKKDGETVIMGKVINYYTSNPISNFPVFVYRNIDEFSDEFAYDYRYENYGMSSLSSVSSSLIYENKFNNIIDTLMTDRYGEFYKEYNFKSSGDYEIFILRNNYISTESSSIKVGEFNRIDIKVKKIKIAKFDFYFSVPGAYLNLNLYYNIGNGKLLKHFNIQKNPINTVVYFPIIPDDNYFAQIYINNTNYDSPRMHFDTIIKGYCYSYNDTITFNIKNN